MDRLTLDLETPGLLVVNGDVDAVSAEEFGTAIEQVAGDLQLDLERCRFMDSSGLAALARARTVFRARGRALTLVAPSRPVRRLLEVCGMVELFTIEDRADAQRRALPHELARDTESC